MLTQQTYDGLVFNRDRKTGYYLCTRRVNGKRYRLHCYVWEKNHGEIPKGYHVHHKDYDRENNAIENLALWKASKHQSHHSSTEEAKERSRHNLNVYARPVAAKWHSTEEARNIAKKNWYKTLGKHMEIMVDLTCEQCSGKYSVDKLSAKAGSRFCSNNCKSAWRRKAGLDNETRTCIVCKKEYQCNKYTKSKSCSRKCRGVISSETKTGVRRY